MWISVRTVKWTGMGVSTLLANDECKLSMNPLSFIYISFR